MQREATVQSKQHGDECSYRASLIRIREYSFSKRSLTSKYSTGGFSLRKRCFFFSPDWLRQELDLPTGSACREEKVKGEESHSSGSVSVP